MAIRDLLWACPLCGAWSALRADRRRSERCVACDAVLTRAHGSVIVARAPGGAAISRTALEWQDRLPPLAGRYPIESTDALGPEDARIRRVTGFVPVRFGTELLGWAERFGPREAARIRLATDSIDIETGQGTESIPVGDITAIQPSSSTLQIGLRDRPLLSIRFLTSSIRLWEHVLQNRIRLAARLAGKGEVTEFQPVVRIQGGAPPTHPRAATGSAEALLRDEAADRPVAYPPERSASAIYRTCQWIARTGWRRLARLTVIGIENVPATGPFLLVSNHQSDLDPAVIQSVIRRPVHAVAKSTLFTVPGLGWLLRRLNAFPVRRFQVDPQAVRIALRRLRAGAGVAIYIEGERSWDARLQDYRPGTVRLALKAGAPVVPVAVTGSYEASPRWDSHIRPAPITVRFMDPIRFPKLDRRADRNLALDTAATILMKALQTDPAIPR